MPRPPGDVSGVTTGGNFAQAASEREIRGARLWVPTAIEDIGFKLNTFDSEPKVQRTVVLRGYLADNGTAVRVDRDVTLSYDDRASLMAHVAASRGGVMPDDDEVVRIEEIIGTPIQVTVDSKARKRGGYFIQLKNPSPIIEGTPVPECLEPYTLEPGAERPRFVSKPEAELDRIRKALEQGKRRPGYAAQPNEGDDDNPLAPVHPASNITRGKWGEVGPVLRRCLDAHFEGDLARMLAHFEGQGDDPIALTILDWVKRRDDGRVVISLAHRSDPDADDLKDALEDCMAHWSSQPRDDGGEIDPDDLPF